MDTGLTPELEDVLATHGGRWVIGQDTETAVWTAVRKPSPTALHLIVSHTLAGLNAKLDADAEGGGP